MDFIPSAFVALRLWGTTMAVAWKVAAVGLLIMFWRTECVRSQGNAEASVDHAAADVSAGDWRRGQLIAGPFLILP